MTQIRFISVVLFMLCALPTGHADSLEQQLKDLDQGNQAPAAVTSEKLYAVQTRYLPLKYKSEFTVGGGYNLTADSFLTSQQLEVGYRFHFSDRWAAAVNYAWVDNKFKSEAGNLRASDGAIPDVPYASSRADLMAEFNAFYGKFRFTAETVSYFDVYIAAGPGIIQQNTGQTTAAVGDVGFVFWIGRFASARVGLKDYYYTEQYQSGAQNTQNLHAHLDIGYIL